MKKIRLSFVLLAFAVCFGPGAPGALAAQPAKAVAGKSAKVSCNSCHADIQTVLPKDHPKTKGEGIAACTSCHKPNFAGEARKSPFSARMHRAHAGGKAGVECTACHAWVPGKSFGLTGAKGSWGAPTGEQMDGLKKAFASWAGSEYTDRLHGKQGIVCAGCHGKKLPNGSETPENSRCLACHGPLEKLAAKSEPAEFKDRNPHKSHLGEINCTVCHFAHEASKVYCLECHKNFDMKIRGAGKQQQL